MSVHLRGELTRSVKPGDCITITGIHLTQPFTGFRAMRAGLLTSTCLHVRHDKQSYSDLQMDSKMDAQIQVGQYHLLANQALADVRP